MKLLPVVVLESESADGECASCFCSEDSLCREVHCGFVQLLCWRVLLALKMQGSLIPKGSVQLRFQLLTDLIILRPYKLYWVGGGVDDRGR